MQSSSRDILPSLSFVSELVKTSQNIYDVLVMLIQFAMWSTNTLSFSKEEAAFIVNEFYGFSLPQALITRALKILMERDICTKSKGKYSLLITENESFMKLKQDFSNTVSAYDELIAEISSYSKKSKLLQDVSLSKMRDSFFHFISNSSRDNDSDNYYMAIELFLIENESNYAVTSSLKSVKKGLIIYNGSCTTPILRRSEWKNELNIFLATDVLFNLNGLNGEQEKQMVLDFIGLANEVNVKNKLINFYLLPESKDDIERFFFKAEKIVSKEESLDPSKEAMSEIIKNCTTKEDIIKKKIDFYELLKRHSIFEYTDEYSKAHEFHLATEELISSIQKSFTKDVEREMILDAFDTLDRINFLREGKSTCRFEDVRYFYVTNKSLIKHISLDTCVKYNPGDIPLATTVGFLTEKFWFLLNKGFSNSALPLSFDVVAKAKAALSAKLSNDLYDKYISLQGQYQNGELSDRHIEGLYYEFLDRLKLFRTDSISVDTVPSIIEFYHEEEFEKFLAEKENFKQKSEIYKAELNKEILHKKSLTQELESAKADKDQIALEKERAEAVVRSVFEDDIVLWEVKNKRILNLKKISITLLCIILAIGAVLYTSFFISKISYPWLQETISQIVIGLFVVFFTGYLLKIIKNQFFSYLDKDYMANLEGVIREKKMKYNISD